MLTDQELILAAYPGNSSRTAIHYHASFRTKDGGATTMSLNIEPKDGFSPHSVAREYGARFLDGATLLSIEKS